MKTMVLFLIAAFLCTPALAEDFDLKADVGRTAHVISPYIYGQFVEHVGNSVYGGMWAEMLEDRKFCFAVTSNYEPFGTTADRGWNSGPYQYLKASPWKIVGPANAVTMDTAHPYVGKQSPLVQVASEGEAAGISQEGLALVAGKRYTGRIVIAGNAGPVTIQLVTGSGTTATTVINQLTIKFQAFSFELTAPRSAENARLEITSKGKGEFRIGAVSLMPTDNIRGWRADTVACLKELNAPIYRWPGGNFVSGYNWRDSLGDPDKRAPRKNPAWKGIEHNDVGIHEFMDLMDIIHAEPYIALNLGTGSAEEAVNEVEYIVGSNASPMGKQRQQNGHPEPWSAKYWAVGNEMYGSWQLGHMPQADFAKKQNQTVEAIRKIDPKSQLVASGAVGTWDEKMYKSSADYMDLMSEHMYARELPDVTKHASQLAQAIKRIATAERRYRETMPELKGKTIPIVLDEWGYWYGAYKYGELGVQYHLKDALGVAMGYHELFRNSDLFFMANNAQAVNVLGSIKTSRTEATLDTTGVVQALYRAHFGSIPIIIEKQPSSDLDISAAWTEDKSAITVAIVNSTKNNHQLNLDVGSLALKDAVTQWEIKGTDPQASNQPGKSPEVKVEQHALTTAPKALPAPALSIEMYRLEKR